MKNVIIFDFDGVIVNTLDIVYSIHSGRNPSLSKEKYLGYLHGNDFSIKATDNHDIRLDDYAFSLYGPKLVEEPLVNGIGQVIETLARDFILVIVSSSRTDLITKYLEVRGIEKYFDLILGLEAGKSKTEKFRYILEKFKVGKEGSFFITDTLGDVQEANSVGLASVGVTWGFHDKAILEKGKPLKIIDKPNDILKIVYDHWELI